MQLVFALRSSTFSRLGFTPFVVFALASLLGPCVATAQREDTGAVPLSTLIRAAEANPGDEEAMDLVATRLEDNFKGLIEKQKAQLLSFMNREATDVTRFLGLAESRKLKLAPLGSYLMISRNRFEQYSELVRELRRSDRNVFLKFANKERRVRSYDAGLDPDVLANEMLSSTIWNKAVASVLDDRSTEFQNFLTRRNQRWRQGATDYFVSVLDRKLVLTTSQVESLERQFLDALSNDLTAYRQSSRFYPGISGRQLWGQQIPIDKENVFEALSPTQRRFLDMDATLAHFRFNGTLEDESPMAASFSPFSSKLQAGGLYADGKYRNRGERILTPALNPKSFTVCLRIKPATDKIENVLTACYWSRWFGLDVKDGRLNVTLNNQRFSKRVDASILLKDRWATIVCSVNFKERRILVQVDSLPMAVIKIPQELQLSPGKSEWMFSNYSNGQVFHGLVDELLLINRALSAGEIAALPVTHGFVEADSVDRQSASPAVLKTIRARQELWIDYARQICELDDDTAEKIRLALTEYDDERLRDWKGENRKPMESISESYGEIVAAQLPKDLGEKYRASVISRERRISQQENRYVESLLCNKLLLSPNQEERLSALVKAELPKLHKQDRGPDMIQLVDGLLQSEMATVLEPMQIEILHNLHQ